MIDSYTQLTNIFPLAPITSPSQYTEAVEVLGGILDSPGHDPNADAYLLVLSDFVRSYEEKTFSRPLTTPGQTFDSLCRSARVTIEQVAYDTGIRLITLLYLRRDYVRPTPKIQATLASYFSVPISTFQYIKG